MVEDKKRSLPWKGILVPGASLVRPGGDAGPSVATTPYAAVVAMVDVWMGPECRNK